MLADDGAQLRKNVEALLTHCSYAEGSFNAAPYRAHVFEVEEEQLADATGSHR